MKKELKEVVASYRSLRGAEEGTREWYAWMCMNENVTYRLDAAANKKFSIGFRVLLRTLDLAISPELS